MATYLEQYLSQIRGIRQRIEALAGGDFELNELKDLTSTAGLQTEHFIRAVVIPATSSKNDFAGLINTLKLNGFSKELWAGLHRLRELYNSTKHDPLFVPAIQDILERRPQPPNSPLELRPFQHLTSRNAALRKRATRAPFGATLLFEIVDRSQISPIA
jgi:hypothetical protein